MQCTQTGEDNAELLAASCVDLSVKFNTCSAEVEGLGFIKIRRGTYPVEDRQQLPSREALQVPQHVPLAHARGQSRLGGRCPD